jgi:hypothetical protein
LQQHRARIGFDPVDAISNDFVFKLQPMDYRPEMRLYGTGRYAATNQSSRKRP